MRDTLFNQIVSLLEGLTDFQGEDGSLRVYDYPVTAPSGYPYVVVGSESFESTVLDNARDSRRYLYKLYIVGEKFGEPGGVSQSAALARMRRIEDNVVAAIDADYFLGRQDLVIRTMPLGSQFGLTDNGSRVVLTLNVQVDTTPNITP